MSLVWKTSSSTATPSRWMRLGAKIPFAHLTYTALFLAYIVPSLIDGSLVLHLSAPNTSEMASVSRRPGYVELSALETLRPSAETTRRYARLLRQ